ncbi:MAG: 3,4-dihydroxy-2-butanone-4-phosphate synthase [Proteobacteria bacterium]|jgi:3,4-dihydroxy 2-butanone 4-phosphate synthase / GTP cyclohydrolase II|nr:3,4-dihydroxy-2-butanone-4-phosphate synthase [Pseudomonadota bacterium]
MSINTIEEVLEDYRQGKIVIFTDDEDRENEGDLMMAADAVDAEAINFMARYGRGLICLALTEERCDQLDLPLMVGENGARFSTNFTVSIEAAEGVTTGISAADRATTVRAAVDRQAVPEDIVTPGHIFPIMARSGGVLSRAGHTEAGIDMARLAGRDPSSVICEVLNDDGSMARMPDLKKFADQHQLKLCSITELIRYRMQHEPSVERVHEMLLDTAIGGTFKNPVRTVVFNDKECDETHIALVIGDIDPEVPIPVRVHVESDLMCSILTLQGRDIWSPDRILRFFEKQGSGVLVILRYDQTDIEVLKELEDSTIEFKKPGTGDKHLRLLGAGSQILADLGVRKMRVLGKPKKVHGLSGFELEIVDYITEISE